MRIFNFKDTWCGLFRKVVGHPDPKEIPLDHWDSPLATSVRSSASNLHHNMYRSKSRIPEKAKVLCGGGKWRSRSNKFVVQGASACHFGLDHRAILNNVGSFNFNGLLTHNFMLVLTFRKLKRIRFVFYDNLSRHKNWRMQHLVVNISFWHW